MSNTSILKPEPFHKRNTFFPNMHKIGDMLACNANLMKFFTKCPRNGSAHIFWWKHNRTRNSWHKHNTEDPPMNKMERESGGSLKMMRSWNCFCREWEGGWLGTPSRVDRWCGGPRCGWRPWVGHASSPHFLQGHSLSRISLMVWGMQTGCCWKDKIFKPVARSDWRAFHIGRVRKKVITQAHTDGPEERKELRDLRVWWG